ncbi:multidrug effflux MFS transporter [Cellulomonas sp. Sa3CUA2]|uniref:Multidrug effflux MFS transporter n=1 Tax=Cellulomonas avistercoris TaxID=2762242 RepID=A0ABR8QET8_9CELL|nr:multidrug effflux MFS transporter [Cellulomonas avistercoris]MBD7918948.1 multidrug effflux MFS transporter [Cellulomonas avistercoris]
MRALLVLGLVTWLGPLSLDAYGPALPAIAVDLDAGPTAVQLTLSALVVGLAVGHLFAGSLSDRFGRRPVLLTGLAAFVVTTTMCALAPGIGTLVVARLLQGLAAATALVITKAAARDLYDGVTLARFLSHLAAIMPVAPALGPLLAAVLLEAFSWRAIFVLVAAVGAAALVVVHRSWPETSPAHVRAAPAGGRTLGPPGRQVVVELLRDRGFLTCVITFALGSAVGLVLVAGAPFVLQEGYGLSPQAYSLLFVANAVVLVGAAQLNARLLRRLRPGRVVALSLTCQLAVAGALTVALSTSVPVGPILVGLVVIVFFHGFLMPNLVAIGMHGVPQQRAGTAAALIGAGQFLVGGLAAPVVGLLGARPAALGATMVALATAALVVHLGGERRRRARGAL